MEWPRPHFSPNVLNKWMANPSLCIGLYLLGWEDKPEPAAKRGNALEKGLDHWFYGIEPKEDKIRSAKYLAEQEFAELTDGQADEAHEKERALLWPMLQQAMEATKGFPLPHSRQMKVEHYFDGIEIPIIGYYDYLFPEFGIDLKTTMRIPSAIRPDHARQLSLYSKVKGVPFKALYVSDKRYAIHELSTELAERSLKELERAARSLLHVLSKADDAMDMARMFAPDFTNFTWSDETRLLAEKVWP